MIRIGLVDHHLNNYHSDTFFRLTNGPLASEQAKITAAYESNPSGDDWCAKNNVKRCTAPEEVVQNVDFVMVMAPDNIEVHPQLAQKVLPYKKPTFFDKFLANSVAEATSIISLAKQNSVPIMSSSALTFAVELEQMMDSLPKEPTEMYCRGLSKWTGYGVHTISPVIRVMGPDFRRLIDTGTNNAHTVTLDYGSNRKAFIEVRSAENEWDFFPWEFGIRLENKYLGAKVKDFDGFYSNLMRQVIQFFNTGSSTFSVEQSLATVKVIENAVKSQQSNGDWIE